MGCRIVFVSDAWFPQVNGVVTVISCLKKRLERMGVEVHLIHPGLFRTFPLPSYPEIGISLLPGKRVGEIIEPLDPEYIHIFSEGPLGWSARNYCQGRGIRFTSSFHSRFPEYIRMRTGLPLSWSYPMMRRFHRAASATLVTTPTMAATLDRKGFGNLRLWGLGVDTDLFNPYGERLFHGVEEPVFAYVGRLAVEKGVEDFLKLKLPGTRIVVGDGPLRMKLEAKYGDRVRFTGFLKGEMLASAYRSADVVVFPSRSDTFGLTVAEAQACGTPVASYDVPGPADIIVPGITGFTGPDLAGNALACLGLQPSACRERALAYSWDRSAERFLELQVPARPTGRDRCFFSIVVPAHNEEKELGRTLQALKELDYPADRVEVLVVENGSTDGTLDVAGKFEGGPFRVLRCGKGVSRAKNHGLDAISSQAEWVILLDADTRLSRNFLDDFVRYISIPGRGRSVAGTVSIGVAGSGRRGTFWMRVLNAVHRVTKTSMSIQIVRGDVARENRFDEALCTNEDTEFLRKCLKSGSFFFFPCPGVETSSRRFDEWGYMRVILFWLFSPFLPKGHPRRVNYHTVR